VNASALKWKLVTEFEAVSSAAGKVGGRQLLRDAARLDKLRGNVLWVVEPPNTNGVAEAEARELRDALDGVRDAATAAITRKRRVEGFIVGVFVVGVALGFLLGLVAAFIKK
jgi:hypothetical protein